MSYDLYFYKQKAASLTEAAIANYLNTNLTPVNDRGNQWFFENNETGVYFSIETNEPSNDPDDIELFESFAGFDNTYFSFNLNFLRPSFFGLEAFQFVDKFIKNLGLFVLNPQGGLDIPYIPSKDELFENWNRTNLSASKDHFGDKACYYPMTESNEVWEHNFNRQRLQTEVGDGYFVAKIFFFKRLHDNNAVTLSMWPEHIPIILPKTDYYLIGQQYKKLFKTIKNRVIITRQEFLEKFNGYFGDYPFKECKIIHPANATKVASIFNGLKSDIVFEEFMEGVGVDYVYNAQP